MSPTVAAYIEAAKKIIKQQESVIGPLAVDQARKVAGLQVSETGDLSLTGNGKDILAHLVEQYEHLFGQASIEVCKDAVREVKPPIATDDLPDILK